MCQLRVQVAHAALKVVPLFRAWAAAKTPAPQCRAVSVRRRSLWAWLDLISAWQETALLVRKQCTFSTVSIAGLRSSCCSNPVWSRRSRQGRHRFPRWMPTRYGCQGVQRQKLPPVVLAAGADDEEQQCRALAVGQRCTGPACNSHPSCSAALSRMIAHRKPAAQRVASRIRLRQAGNRGCARPRFRASGVAVDGTCMRAYGLS